MSDKRLHEELVIDFKAETAKKRTTPRKPPREPDWQNHAKLPIKVWAPGDADESRKQVIRILRSCADRLETLDPEQIAKTQSSSWPFTSMGLSLMKAITLLDALADKAKAERVTQGEGS